MARALALISSISRCGLVPHRVGHGEHRAILRAFPPDPRRVLLRGDDSRGCMSLQDPERVVHGRARRDREFQLGEHRPGGIADRRVIADDHDQRAETIDVGRAPSAGVVDLGDPIRGVNPLSVPCWARIYRNDLSILQSPCHASSCSLQPTARVRARRSCSPSAPRSISPCGCGAAKGWPSVKRLRSSAGSTSRASSPTRSSSRGRPSRTSR